MGLAYGGSRTAALLGAVSRPFVTALRAFHLGRMRAGHRRAVRFGAVTLGALILLSLSTHLLALAYLHDISLVVREEARGPARTDAFVDRGGSGIVQWDGRGASVWRRGGVRAEVRGHRYPIEAAMFLGPDPDGELVSVDGGGGIRAQAGSRAGPDLAALQSAYEAGRRWIWDPIGRPLARAALGLALRFERLDVPAVARPQMRGQFQDCPDCPGMTIIGGGWAIIDSAGGPALHALDAPVAISITPVRDVQWRACINAGYCRSVPRGAPTARQMSNLLTWIAGTTGRNYRVARAEEVAFARQAMQVGGTVLVDDLGAPNPRLASDDPVLRSQGDAQGEATFGGRAGAPELVMLPCGGAAPSNLALATLGRGMADTGQWGAVRIRFTPISQPSAPLAPYVAGKGDAVRLSAELIALGAPRAVISIMRTGAGAEFPLTVFVCEAAS